MDWYLAGKSVSFQPQSFPRFSSDLKDGPAQVHHRGSKTPAEDFAPLAAVFRRRLLVGVESASLVTVGANFAGITSFFLGFSPETGRRLKLDVLYPVQGYSRCLETDAGFEFVYPASWVGDQRLLYREATKAESKRSLDPPSLNDGRSIRRSRDLIQHIVAFSPPGTNGELNVSVIVSQVPIDFSIEAFGGPREVGEAVIRTIAFSSRQPDINATLIDSTMREDPARNISYYKLEFRVKSPSFRRHNVAVCTAYGGRLFSLNAQAPESAWPGIKEVFYKIADSFNLTS